MVCHVPFSPGLARHWLLPPRAVRITAFRLARAARCAPHPLGTMNASLAFGLACASPPIYPTVQASPAAHIRSQSCPVVPNRIQSCPIVPNRGQSCPIVAIRSYSCLIVPNRGQSWPIVAIRSYSCFISRGPAFHANTPRRFLAFDPRPSAFDSPRLYLTWRLDTSAETPCKHWF